MRNISQDVIEVINFYRSLVMELVRHDNADIDEIISREYISRAVNEECEYLKVILERED